jgi:hypothetical protein
MNSMASVPDKHLPPLVRFNMLITILYQNIPQPHRQSAGVAGDFGVNYTS